MGLGAALVLCVAPGVHAQVVEVWLRARGDPQGARQQRVGARTIDLSVAPLEEVERFDPQYGARFRYRGVPLGWLLEQNSPPASVDAALLHFENGMIIPLPFRDQAAMERLAPFVALAVWSTDRAGDEGWHAELPDLPKKGEEAEDWRPIRFRGNKLVVRSLWHPDVPRAALAVFSPWAHADRLVGVELVRSEAYRRQFQVPGAKPVTHGYRIYAERCQFCHGVGKVGASFGWDFAVPIALHTYREPKSLFLHAKYRELNATSRGLMMPAFADLGMPQVDALWAWMEAIAGRGPAPYAP